MKSKNGVQAARVVISHEGKEGRHPAKPQRRWWETSAGTTPESGLALFNGALGVCALEEMHRQWGGNSEPSRHHHCIA